MVWMNERRQVKIGKLLDKATESSKQILNVDSVSEENNFALVHVKGKLSTKMNVNDESFGISISDCVKL